MYLCGSKKNSNQWVSPGNYNNNVYICAVDALNGINAYEIKRNGNAAATISIF